ncbi:MAG: hypothetical protein RML36_03825 [Anaerolineae bacterium]|nr:alkaline phosphatase family protein [Anaerolineae bacterium]MDW8098599.1 hypothetical protein [Anaerolineae bacterium]
MSRIAVVVLATLWFAGVTAGSYLVTDRFLAAAYAPRPAIPADGPLGEGGPPLVERLVLIIVDGLRSDALTAMPFSDELWARGASAVLHLSPPAYAGTGWRTLLTGASVELLGMPLLPDAGWHGPSLSVGSLIGLAAASGRTCAVALHETWRSLLPEPWCSARLFVAGDDATADQEIADGARDMERGRPSLMVVHFSHVAATGSKHQATSAFYRQAAQAVDGMIRRVAEPALANGAAVAVVSSHGLNDSGGMVGAEASITQVPFFLVGPGVIPGGYGVMEGEDVAPTLAALIGLPAPPLAQGQVRYDMLLGDMPWQAGRHLRMARQRLELARRYLEAWGFSKGDLSSIAEEIARAEQALRAGDVETSWIAANAALHAADGLMRQIRATRLARERLPRLVAAIVGLFASWLGWAIWQRRQITLAVSAALTGLVTMQLVFLAGGGRYSLSSAQPVEPFLTFALWQSAAGVGAAMAIILGWHIGRGAQRTSLVSEFLGAAWAMLLAWALPVAIGYWRHGFGTSWQMPDVSLAFWQLWGLSQLWAISMVVIPATWLIAGSEVFAARWWKTTVT